MSSSSPSNGSGDSLDELIARLRARAADPERRADARQSEFSASVTSMSLGDLIQGIMSGGADLRRLVAANKAGVVDAEMAANAEAIGAAMSTPASIDLPAPTPASALDRAESDLGFALPPVLRRIYSEVADGGFGPGPGLLPIAGVVAAYRELSQSTPVGQAWPERLLPLVKHDPWFDCVDAASPAARVVGSDPEELEEDSSEQDWAASFSEMAPSLEAWLSEWVSSRPAAEVFAEQMEVRIATSMVEDARSSRAMIGAMTPEERAAMGLPEVGWEREVWGGLGLDEDPSADSR
jgi:hypothetical protein